jgi:pimeloyl-ACP methyl ester carboxylesterase
VNWDQRGAGLSWHEGMDESKITEDQLVDDALELTRYLIETYKKDKIYIIGHSYGSIIGMRLASEHPELYHAYIGMGQVLDWDRSVAYTKKWLTAEMKKADDQDGLKKLESSAVPDMDEVIKYGGHTHKTIDYNKIIMNSPYYFDGYIDLKNRARKLVQRNITKNRSTMSFWDIEEFRIPIYFFEGRFDHVTACAPELVVEFCEKTEAPVKEIVWFEDSAHMPNLEEPVKFQQMIIEKLLK